ncbi:hypothetical protein Hanom_Chr16g01477791 [Helianthus anomalus]
MKSRARRDPHHYYHAVTGHRLSWSATTTSTFTPDKLIVTKPLQPLTAVRFLRLQLSLSL